MPLNVRRFYTSIVLVLVAAIAAFAQSQAVNQPSPVPSTAAPATVTPIKTMTAAEVMRERISKAKAFIAVRNYNAAIYELEMVRRETSDPSVHAVTNILLMNSYLEQGNYTKAQNFLNDAFKNFKANNANGSMFYSAVAGQVVKGARNQLERYRSLGLTVSDRNLPVEAVNDIEKMRETVELVITQTKELSANKTQSAASMPILDEAIAARSGLGRDDYDAKRWRDEGRDIREEIASSRSIVINAVDGAILPNTTPAIQQPTNTATNLSINSQQAAAVTSQQTLNSKPSDTAVASAAGGPAEIPAANNTARQVLPEPQLQKGESAPVSANPVQNTESLVQKTVISQAVNAPSAEPVNVGSLLEYATSKTQPVYPSNARAMRAAGTVKAEVVVDENGNVTEVKNVAGHALLQAAVKDAVKRWKFRPVLRDGQPVRASGFVNFNFAL